MALSEKYIIENPENYITSTYFYSKLYGIDASNNVDKLDPWQMGIECLLRSDGRDRVIRENSKFSIKNLEVRLPMNVGKVSNQIKELLKLLKTKQSNEMLQKPIEDFFKMVRWYDTFHTNPVGKPTQMDYRYTHQWAFTTSSIDSSDANKLLFLSNIQPYKPLVLNLFRDVNQKGKLVKTKMKWSDLSQFDHKGNVILNDISVIQNPNSYWTFRDVVEADMQKIKFDLKRITSTSNLSAMNNADPDPVMTMYSAFQKTRTVFGTYMFLRDKKTKKIINHQELAHYPFKPDTLRSVKKDIIDWPFSDNNLYSNTERYCKERMGVSTVSHSNGSVEYQSTHRSIFDMDTNITKDWSMRSDASIDSTHLKAMKTLKMPMMFFNRNVYGKNGSTYSVHRSWYLNRTLEDYEILIPHCFREEIEDSMSIAQLIIEPLESRIKRQPQELKSIVDALKTYVIDFNNNPQMEESDKTKSTFTRSTCIDHTTKNRDILKKSLCNLTSADVLELWGGMVCLSFNPFMKRTGYIITEKIATSRWSFAPFYSNYIYRSTTFGVFAPEGLIKRYQLSITPIPKNVDYSKPYRAGSNFIELASKTNSIPLFTIHHFYPYNNNFLSSKLYPVMYFVEPRETNILTKLKELGYPKNFLQIQETVIFSEDCQKILYVIDHKRYSRLTIFTNEKIFLNSANYKFKLYSRANVNPFEFFRIVSTNTSSIHLHFYRYDSTNIKQVFDVAAVDKTPHPMKNVILAIHEPRIQKSDTTTMTDFRFHKKVTYIVAPKTAYGDLQTDFTTSISDSILQDDLKMLQNGSNKGQLYIQLNSIMLPTSFKDKKIERLFILSDLAENNRFYIDYTLQPVLATINVTEKPFIQRHIGQNGSVSISLSDNDKTSIAPIIPIDQIYKLNSFFVKVIDQKSRVVEFTNDKFPIDLTISLYYKKKILKRQHVW